MESKAKILSIVGIDTDVGKSVVTGMLARYLADCGNSVTTLKLVQTGCEGISEDILLHRKLMGVGVTAEDNAGTTCPYVFPFPASPHLAAKLAGQVIEKEKLDKVTRDLTSVYEWLLVEGAGGLMVPLNDNLLLVDYLAEKNYPLVLVTSSKLGSINHTRLSLEAIKQRNIPLQGVVYNLHTPAAPAIVQDSLQQCRTALSDYGFSAPVIVMPDTGESKSINWQPLVASITGS